MVAHRVVEPVFKSAGSRPSQRVFNVRDCRAMTSGTPAASRRLVGRTALVTGASKGIGLAIAAAYASEGAAVMLSSRKQAQLDDAAAGIRASTPGAEVAVFAANAGDPEAAEACVAATVERFGALDILVNNAATNPSMGPTIEADLGAWDKTFQVNLRGLFVWTQLAWRARMKEHGGAVVNLSSIGGLRGDASIGVYNTTKAAIIHLTKILAVDMGPKVRVNAIAPGLVKTDFARALWEEHGDLAARALPMKRLGEPEDIAPAAVFLASDEARWVTGHTLVVDGGALAGPSVVGG
jgi:NAD(P)-dependent dehydrogenase (short-subunit alcohol dehydrogenase family)